MIFADGKKIGVGSKILGSVGQPETQVFFFFFLAFVLGLMKKCNIPHIL